MAMKRCPVCGEKYSDTYKYCPFCEEEEALRSGNAPRRRSGHRVAQSGPNLLSPILIILILLMVCALAYLLFGDSISAKLGFGKTENIPAASISEPAASSSSGATSSGAASSGEVGDQNSGVSSEELVALPDTLTMSSKDFTMKVGDSPVKLTVSDGGSYTWSSDDDGIASVSADGSVTAISAGTVTITASNGTEKGTCIVRVKGTGTANTSTGTANTGTTNATLSKTDVSLKAGESFTLSVSGTTASVSFAAENTSIATVTEGGKVTGVASGKTNITATVDGKTLTCIVRVK